MIEPFPLNWIPEKQRTPSNKRKRSQFQVNFAKARNDLLGELKRLKATNIVISSNVETRQDGLPKASFKEPEDPGIAVYFRSFKKEYALSCDRWDKVKDNVRAIGKHIKALRGIEVERGRGFLALSNRLVERWGVSSVEEAFEPFLLPTRTSHGS